MAMMSSVDIRMTATAVDMGRRRCACLSLEKLISPSLRPSTTIPQICCRINWSAIYIFRFSAIRSLLLPGACGVT